MIEADAHRQRQSAAVASEVQATGSATPHSTVEIAQHINQVRSATDRSVEAVARRRCIS
jgi:methyl-accepting chemotaxis protein